MELLGDKNLAKSCQILPNLAEILLYFFVTLPHLNNVFTIFIYLPETHLNCL